MEVFMGDGKSGKIMLVPFWFMLTCMLAFLGGSVAITTSWVEQKNETKFLRDSVVSIVTDMKEATVRSAAALSHAAAAQADAMAVRLQVAEVMKDVALVKAWAAGVVGKPLPNDSGGR